MNIDERVKMVKCMEFIIRHINNEDYIDSWLMGGVADGDIDYGDTSSDSATGTDLDFYIDDDNFSELMGLFIRLISKTKRSGLYCDKILSETVYGTYS